MNDRKGFTKTESPMGLEELQENYSRILRDYVDNPNEGSLLRASELGKKALDAGIGLLEVAAVHYRTIEPTLKTTGVEPGATMDRASEVLLEILASYEISSRGFLDKLEEARRKSEADVKAIFASAQDGVLVVDDDRRLVDCNQAFGQMLGFSRSELLKCKEANVEGVFGGISEDAISQLKSKGYFKDYEHEFMRRDGRIVITSLSGARIGSTREGKPWRAFAFVKDITEAKRAEEALRASEERYRTLYESSIDGIADNGLDGRFIDANEAYLQLVGYTREEMRNLSYQQLTPEKWRYLEEELIEPQVLARGFSDLYEKEVIRKDGTIVPVSVRRWLVRDEAGKPKSIWAIVRDITERKRAEQDLQRINAELEGFAHTVSHDLRNPLSTIVLSVELLHDAALEKNPEVMRDEVKDAEKTIRTSIARSYNLIDDLLALAESGQKPTSFSDVDVAEVVESVREEHEREIAARGIKLEHEPDMGTIRANQTHIYQLFSNLIGNSITHNTSPQPEIKVSYRGTTREGVHRYTVCDNGPGIPEEDVNRIFQPFFKSAKSSRTGVGLAIVQKVVSVYGGSIRAYNDNGACFDLRLRDWEQPRSGTNSNA